MLTTANTGGLSLAFSGCLAPVRSTKADVVMKQASFSEYIGEVSSTTRHFTVDVVIGHGRDSAQIHYANISDDSASSGYDSEDHAFFNNHVESGIVRRTENDNLTCSARLVEIGTNKSGDVFLRIDGKCKNILKPPTLSGSAPELSRHAEPARLNTPLGQPEGARRPTSAPPRLSLPKYAKVPIAPAASRPVTLLETLFPKQKWFARSVVAHDFCGYSLHSLTQDRYAQPLSAIAAKVGAPPVSCWGGGPTIATHLDQITALRSEHFVTSGKAQVGALNDMSKMSWLPEPVLLNAMQSRQSVREHDMPKAGFWRSMLNAISRWLPQRADVSKEVSSASASADIAMDSQVSLDEQVKRELQQEVSRRWKTGGTMVSPVHIGSRSRTSASLRQVMAQAAQRPGTPRTRQGGAASPPMVPKGWRSASQRVPVGKSFPVQGNEQQLKTRF